MSLAQIFKGTLAVLAAVGIAAIVAMTLNVWVSVLVAIVVASALRKPVLRLKKLGIPQNAAVLIVYGGLAVATFIVLVLVLPPVINQFTGYLTNEDRLANRIIWAMNWIEIRAGQLTGTDFEMGIDSDSIRETVADVLRQIRITAPSLLGGATGFIGEFVLIIAMGLYWMSTRERAEQFLIELTPLSRRPQVEAILNEIETVLGGYVRSVALVSVIVGVICFVALTLLQIPNAATISFFYAVATAIPIVGGLIGVLVSTFVALLSSPSDALIVLAVTFLLQQVENYWLTPRLMSQSADFDPLLVVVFVSMGFTLGGVVGALLAIPVAGTASILVKQLILEPRKASVVPTRVEGGIPLLQEPAD